MKPNHPIRALILDMDGVLWRDKTPIGDLPQIFGAIEKLELKVMLATNNATRTPTQYVEKLTGFGVNVTEDQIVNSGLATAQYLKNRFPEGGNLYVVGDQPLIELLAGFGFQHSPANPLAVVAALDRSISYEKLTQATLLIRGGVPFIGTNPDKSFPIPQGQAPGAGAILAAIEAGSGVAPTIIGKPEPIMYQVAIERLGTRPAETLVIGDRLETDILGAQKAGCPCGLVLSGVTSPEAAQQWTPQPNLIAANLASILDQLEGQK